MKSYKEIYKLDNISFKTMMASLVLFLMGIFLLNTILLIISVVIAFISAFVKIYGRKMLFKRRKLCGTDEEIEYLDSIPQANIDGNYIKKTILLLLIFSGIISIIIGLNIGLQTGFFQSIYFLFADAFEFQEIGIQLFIAGVIIVLLFLGIHATNRSFALAIYYNKSSNKIRYCVLSPLYYIFALATGLSTFVYPTLLFTVLVASYL